MKASKGYEAGVLDVVELARRIAGELAADKARPTRTVFGAVALAEFADALEQELLGRKPGDAVSADPPDQPNGPEQDGEAYDAAFTKGAV